MINNSFDLLPQLTDDDDDNKQFAQTLDLISRHLTTYLGFFLIIFGNINSIAVILLFSYYKSFRQNTCSNYLLLCSLCDLLQLDFGYIFRYLADSLFEYDLTAKSFVWCKFRFFLTQATIMCSFTALLMGKTEQLFT
ncbi:unnamed protein product [Adineta steineri]|uniref:G-protein coupled receptors family 1 profile domain-containing protein n=1 Tax=Adineta steineri TaxID=433720 RepID=A0A815P5Y0_9BILA|nr:unnamed protein product [Adineta steineri]CAF3573946.1 unnamed protein product [Adineta steineri]